MSPVLDVLVIFAIPVIALLLMFAAAHGLFLLLSVAFPRLRHRVDRFLDECQGKE